MQEPCTASWQLAMPATSAGPTRWLMDTGCGHDLVGKHEVPSWMQSFPSQSPVLFNTANGLTNASEQVAFDVPSLNGKVQPYLLNSTPAVLSIGRRCAEDGFGFYWPPRGTPVLETPDGQRLKLEVEGYIPYLPMQVPSAPAAAPKEAVCPDPVPGAPVPPAEGPAPADGDAPGDAGGVSPPGSGSESEEEPDVAGLSKVDQLRAEAVSLEHLMAHKRKNRFCPACQRAKLHVRPALSKRRRAPVDPVPESFGDLVTADHAIIPAEGAGKNWERTALMVLDRATKFLAAYPLMDKSASEATWALSHFAGRDVVTRFYTDGAPELIKAAIDLEWQHDTSTPGKPTNNGAAERAVRRPNCALSRRAT